MFPRALWPCLVAFTLALATVGCERGLAPPAREEGRAVASPGGPFYSDGEAGVRFAVPAGLEVSAQHWPGVTDPGVIRQMFTFTAAGKERLRVELWRDAGGTPLARWFERHLAFMRDGVARVTWGPVAPGAPRGMVFVWPRAGQSTGQRIVLYRLGGLVVRVTCQDGQDRALVSAMEQVIRSLALQGERP